MSENCWFVIEGQVYGMIFACQLSPDTPADLFIPISLEPKPIEFYEQKTAQELLDYMDELIAVFPVLEGAQALLQFLYNSVEMDVPQEVISTLMASLMQVYSGDFDTKTALGITAP